VNEVPVLFGSEDSLVGVYAPAGGGGDLCCLLSNAGLMPRIGPNRLNVKIARELAKQGVASLRFDLAGLGDSRANTGGLSWREQAVHDMRAAMDFAQSHFGKRRFLIFGICSGAENALNAALADTRVIGAFMVDGFWYRSIWSRPVQWFKRLRALTPSRVLRGISRRLRERRATPSDDQNLEFFPGEESANPPRDTYAKTMNTLAARGASIFVLYTNAAAEYVSYSNQLRDAFSGEPFARHIRSQLILDIDHTAVPIVAQRRMIGMFVDWVRGVAAGRADPA
jgi:pimeloyl-ACP methyl ester carboxylesterase